MAALSITTVVLSLKDGCPGFAFYVLEVIINTTMIGEVVIRFLAFGRQFWKYPFNIFDLIVTTFCALTLLVIVFAGCGAASKEEEILDTLLLVARNVLQFGRLAAVVRQSGQSIFTQPKPIDLSAARRAGEMGVRGVDVLKKGLVLFSTSRVALTMLFFACMLRPTSAYILSIHCTGFGAKVTLEHALCEGVVPSGVGHKGVVKESMENEQVLARLGVEGDMWDTA
ncbi:hypothetical protein EWM64_g4453 [Hericium alpestre]|uniref:Ion transport domain-containing protein n=1 Tax=Hericium alpestre TaxID=135208 RepID=A0A4Y9ZZH3_9AGAM|nr:hypothetical protein EWM64_g4453 [Hericium alpestre]